MGGSTYIPTPIDIAPKKPVINPQNSDKQYFKQTIVAEYETGNNKQRVGENYKIHEGKYNFTRLTFLTPPSNVKIFEKNNLNMSVNVYDMKPEKKERSITHTVFSLKVTDDEKLNHFDLLFIINNENSQHLHL